jgi:hypothetical protein
MKHFEPQRVLMDDVADPSLTRDDVVLTYALAIRNHVDVDWPAVNQAITKRWSPHALRYVKTEAWKLLRRVEATR